MNPEALSTLAARSVPLTPREDTQGVKVKLKVFWKTARFWTPADIAGFHNSVPVIAERLRKERYWNKGGDIRMNTFTCEDFAIRMLCEYASARGLPVTLTTGVRTYRNMEMYSAEAHDRYASNVYGFSEMVMLTYGAPDMQRSGTNTVTVANADELMPGDILAQAKDLGGSVLGRAHHIQVVIAANSIGELLIYQGNSVGIRNPLMKLWHKIKRDNVNDPTDNAYAGVRIQAGIYTKKSNNKWDYQNLDTNSRERDFLKNFELHRWNFFAFNK